LIRLINVEDISLVLTFNTRVCRKIQKLINDNSGIVSIADKINFIANRTYVSVKRAEKLRLLF